MRDRGRERERDRDRAYNFANFNNNKLFLGGLKFKSLGYSHLRLDFKYFTLNS